MKIPIVRLEMVVDGYAEYLREPLSSSRKAAEWIGRNVIRNSNREHIVVVSWDASNRATYIDEIGRGSVNYCPGTIAEVFKVAIISNAAHIFLFHNHPSGDPTPSREDMLITKRILDAGALIGIELLDHIIIGNNCYVSFREEGML